MPENRARFAVVASEVRSLARRSAEAAREVKALISASVENVEAGTALVDRAGQTMQEIVQSVQRVSGIIEEITSSTAEQSRDMQQVNAAVGELEQMTSRTPRWWKKRRCRRRHERAVGGARTLGRALQTGRCVACAACTIDGGLSPCRGAAVPSDQGRMWATWPVRGSLCPRSSSRNSACVACGPLVPLHRDPGLGRCLHRAAEGPPRGYQSLVQPRAPHSAVRFSPARGKEHHRARAGQRSCAAQVAYVAGAHGAAIGQLREVFVDALAQCHAAGKVDVNARCIGGQCASSSYTTTRW